MHARLRGSKSLLTLYPIINSLADGIDKPRPNMKVTAFTVSQKSSNTRQQETDKRAWQTWNTNNKKDPQKEHCLGKVSKNKLLEGLNLYDGANLYLITMWIKTNRCLVCMKDP